MLLNQQKPETKLDPRVKRTRKLLQQAFRELLAEKDFAALTVQDITERAEVNRATFYAHFEDKFALMDFSVRESLQEALEKRLPNTHTFTLTSLRLLAVTVNDFVEQFVGYCHPGTHSHNEEQMRMGAQVQQHIYELLLAWLKSTNAAHDDKESVANTAAILSWMIFGTAFQAAITRDKQSPEQLADQMIAFLAPSLDAYLTDSVSE